MSLFSRSVRSGLARSLMVGCVPSTFNLCEVFMSPYYLYTSAVMCSINWTKYFGLALQ